MAARSPFGPFCRRTRPGLLGFSAGLVTTDHSPENRKVVLLSGGVESTTVLHMERDSGTFVIPLFVDYAQRGAEMERAASAAACKSLGLEMLEMNAAGIGETFRSLQGKQRLHVPVPHRNLLILSLALSLAAQQSATAVVLALQAEDGDWYPSASPAFFTAFAAAAATLEPGVDLQAPLRTMRKADVIRAGAELGVDFAQCYSCMRGGQHHCGLIPHIRCVSDLRSEWLQH